MSYVTPFLIGACIGVATVVLRPGVLPLSVSDLAVGALIAAHGLLLLAIERMP